MKREFNGKRLVIVLTMLIIMLSSGLMAAAKKPDAPPGVLAQIASADSASTGENLDTTIISGASDHIPESTDAVVLSIVIPLLVFLLGLWKRNWDKDRFTLLLTKLWGLIKDCDNYFSNPTTQIRSLIDLNGMNAAKKKWVLEQAKIKLSPAEVKALTKKTGSLGNAIELAINVFKFGAAALPWLGKIFKK